MATHPKRGIKDRTSRASNDSTSELGRALPNNLGEVRVGRVVGVILRGFRRPSVDPIGYRVITRPSSQVLCNFQDKHSHPSGDNKQDHIPPYIPPECLNTHPDAQFLAVFARSSLQVKALAPCKAR